MDRNKVFGLTGEPLTARGEILMVMAKQTRFDDPTKKVMAYRVLVDVNGTVTFFWFNTYEPIDGSEPPFIGTRVKLDGNSKETTADEFETAASGKAYEEVPEADWPIQCQKETEAETA
jgi:hypothetical protein